MRSVKGMFIVFVCLFVTICLVCLLLYYIVCFHLTLVSLFQNFDEYLNQLELVCICIFDNNVYVHVCTHACVRACICACVCACVCVRVCA